MRIQPLSFLLGLGAAAVLPLVSRIARPLAVEAAAAGMGLYDEGRRVLAEQMELMEDIAAEARARREHLLSEQTNGNGHGNGSPTDVETPAAAPRRRRRSRGAAGADMA